MDIHLLAFLLLCLCRQGLTDEASTSLEEGTEPPMHISLIPLITSIPILPEATEVPTTPRVIPDPTHDLLEVFHGTPPTTQDTSSEEDQQGECQGDELGAEAKRELGVAIMKFGLELLQHVQASPEQPNVMVSPLSVALGLSQLALGAANETETLLLKALHVDALPCYHSVMKSLLHDITQSALQVATRIYLRPGFQVKKAFEEESLRLYGSEPTPLTSIEEVNSWVKEATKGQIPKFLTSLPGNMLLMLINAVHFKGMWRARFDPRFTSNDLFYIDSKTTVPVDMMLGPKYPLSLLIHNELEAQVARFPFMGNMSLLVILPMSGHVNVATIAAHLNASELYSRFPRERTMQVKLPKLNLKYNEELQNALTGMGLGELFLGPDLSRIGDGPMMVSNVKHEAAMELNEEGAEASATTSIVISRSNPTFSVNQPFLFAIMDDETQTPLFLGIVKNPNPEAMPLQKGDPDKMGFAGRNHVASSYDPK
ncbi:alpha-2-antiplasmin [Amia ocellicauda]|uniref:alpha-2-antiplasmin n=1 Tax=Amia ocellicauda TaxID=2972642 RepID=UPI0034646BFB